MFITPDHHKKGKKPYDFRERKLIFVDLEMTGSDPQVHEIIEIGWLVVEGKTFKILSSYEAKIKPEHMETADPEGLRVAGYSEEEWKKAKNLELVLRKLAKAAPNAMLVGSAVYHDWEFLERAFGRYKIMPKFNYRLLPLEAMAYAKLYNEKGLRGLGMRSSLGKFFKIEFPEEHGALVDAKLSYDLFVKLMQR